MRVRELRWFGLLLGAAFFSAQAQAGVKEGVDAWQANNYAKAVAEWKVPAEQGDADAQFNLGQAYKLGRGVPIDSKIAQSWYLKAAQQGHEQAQANLGLILFQNGDRQGAMPWIRKAAERGEPRAQYVLGTAYFNGDLTARDWPRAYALMTRAAAAGLPQASTSLQQMDQYISPADRQAGIAMAKDLEKGVTLADVAPPAKPVTSPATAKTPPVPAKPVTAAKPATAVAAAKPAAKAAAKPASADAKSAPAPAPAKASAPAKAGEWRIQLGAYGSRAAAEKAWSDVAKKGAASGQQPVYTPVNALTRLQAGPFKSKADANAACAALKKDNANCFAVAP